MTIGQISVSNTLNFLVPAAGQTHVVGYQGAPFTGQPYVVDWTNFKVDNFSFQPQGAYIDNTLSTSATTLTIYPIGMQITVPAGALWAIHWPTPNGSKTIITAPASIAGDICNIWFVDYPVVPFQIAPGGGAANNVVVTGWTAPQTVNVQGTPLAIGAVPYQNNITQFGSAVVTLGQKTMANSMPVTLASDQSTLPVALVGAPGIPTSPSGATFASASSGNVANATATATLAGAIGKSTFCSGFEITAAGATAASVVVATLTGILGGTQSYIFTVPAGVTTGAVPLIAHFDPPLSSSAANTSIAISLPALGAGNTNAAVCIHGYTA